MARVRPRSNIYALLPILACLIMAGGIFATWQRVQKYRGPNDPEPTVKLTTAIPRYAKPEQPKEEPIIEAPTVPGEGAPVAPAEGEGVAPAEGGEGLAPAEGGEGDVAPVPAPAEEGAPAPAKDKPEEKEDEK